MSFILRRTRINERQLYMDRFRIDVDGEWIDPLAPHTGIKLPKQYLTEWAAKFVLDMEREADPSSHYEIDYYE